MILINDYNLYGHFSKRVFNPVTNYMICIFQKNKNHIGPAGLLSVFFLPFPLKQNLFLENLVCSSFKSHFRP